VIDEYADSRRVQKVDLLQAQGACGDAGRGLVTNSPLMISATRFSGAASKSSYVARRPPCDISASVPRPFDMARV